MSDSATTGLGGNTSLLRPEIRILLAAAGIGDEAERAERIRALVRAELDWDFLGEIAERDQVVGLVYQALSGSEPGTIPMRILSRLRTVHLETTQHAMLLKQELVRVLKALAERGVKTLPFKGPVLGLSLYGNVALRQTWDLDILCRKESVLTAKAVLGDIGYELEGGTTEADVPNRLKQDCELNFVHSQSGVVVEIHWNILPRALGRASSGAYMWEGAEETELDGAPLFTATPAAVLKALVVHGGVKHMWDELRFVADVARALAVTPESEVKRVVDELNREGSAHHALAGLLLASVLLGAPLPESLQSKIKNNTLAGAVAALAMGRMFNARLGFPNFSEWCVYLRSLGLLGENERGSLLRFWRGILSPEFNDRTLLPAIPRFLAPVYYVVRAIRLASGPGLVFLRGDSH